MTMLPVPTRGSTRALVSVMAQELPKYFTGEEVHQILSTKLKDNHYKKWFLCLFLWHTGARITEALMATIGDIDLRGRAVRLKTLKRIKHKGMERAVPVPPEFIAEVGLWITTNGLTRGDKIFSFNRKTAYYHVHRACMLAGIDDERCHPHTFRHSFGINCVLQQVPITVIQQWMGHGNIANTILYTKVLAVDSRHFMDNIQW